MKLLVNVRNLIATFYILYLQILLVYFAFAASHLATAMVLVLGT